MKYLITVAFALIFSPLWAEDYSCLGDLKTYSSKEPTKDYLDELTFSSLEDEENAFRRDEFKEYQYMQFSFSRGCSLARRHDGRTEIPDWMIKATYKEIDDLIVMSCSLKDHVITEFYKFNKKTKDFVYVWNSLEGNIKFTGKCY